MKEKMQETSLKLNKSQIQEVINSHIIENNGLHELFEMLLNGLMYSERQSFLSEDSTSENKGNGYRRVKRSGIGSRCVKS